MKERDAILRAMSPEELAAYRRVGGWLPHHLRRSAEEFIRDEDVSPAQVARERFGGQWWRPAPVWAERPSEVPPRLAV